MTYSYGKFTDQTGSHPHLRGCWAMVREAIPQVSDTVLAQFDGLKHLESLGWHPMPRASFELSTGHA